MQDQDASSAVHPSSSSRKVEPLTKELSVLDGVYVLAKRSRLILILFLVGIGLGIFVAFIAPDEYMASAVLMRETRQESSGGSLAALRGLGLNLGEAQAGLTIEAYPEVLMSHEVRFALLDDSFPTASGGPISFVDYVESTTPTSMLGRARRLLQGDSDPGATGEGVNLVDSLSVAYTYEEQHAMEAMSDMLGVDADAETGLMTVSVTAQDPVLAASLAGRLVDELRIRVQELLTEKARADHEFIRARTADAELDLREARALLAQFDDRNRGLTSARLLAERDRLRQNVAFASDVFSQYQGELKQAEIEVQRANPVITVLDRPVVPLLPVRPRRKVIVLTSALFGLALGLIFAFLLEGLHAEAKTEDGRKKRAAIRDVLSLRSVGRAKNPGSATTSEEEIVD